MLWPRPQPLPDIRCTGNPHSRASLQQSPRRGASSRNSLRYIGVTPLGTQRPSKTELVTIRVSQVKESLAPFGISRGCVRLVSRRDYAPIERINLRIVEDHSSPPGPMPLGRLGS